MRPIDTPTSDTRWTGSGDVGDLHAETMLEPTEGGALVRVNRSRWRPTEEERAAIALGADIVLDVFGSVHPPVRVLATVFPVGEPDALFARVDALVEKATTLSLVALLSMVGIEATLDELASEEDQSRVADWLTGWHGRPIGIEWLDERREAAIAAGTLVVPTFGSAGDTVS